MSDGSRIPRQIEEFNSYISTTNTYLLEGAPTTNADRLGILATEVTKWSAIGTLWSPLFMKYSDKKNSRTTAIKDQLLQLITDCVNLDQTCHILDRIAASPNVTIVDMETFNIKKGVLQKTARTVSTSPVAERVMPSIQPIGGGSVSIKCRSTTGEGTAIIGGADSVQYVYQVGNTPPISTEGEGLKNGLSTKASFTVALGTASSAKYLYIYFRWYNTKHPELSGPWSALQTTLIL